MVTDTERWLGSSAAARVLGLSDTRVRTLAARGLLPFTPTPIGRLYRAEDVAKLAADRETQRVQAQQN